MHIHRLFFIRTTGSEERNYHGGDSCHLEKFVHTANVITCRLIHLAAKIQKVVPKFVQIAVRCCFVFRFCAIGQLLAICP